MPAVPQSELDAGPHRAGTERFCALTRKVRPTSEMIRFVVGPEGVVPDIKRKLPGRGVWISATRDALSDAVAQKIFARSFRRDVHAGPDLVDVSERLLARAALNALSMARKAGLVAPGSARAETALARAPVVALVLARDAAADGSSKLMGALRHRPDAGEIAIIDGFSSAELDLALARSNVVHAAVLAGPESRAFLARYARLKRFRTGK